MNEVHTHVEDFTVDAATKQLEQSIGDRLRQMGQRPTIEELNANLPPNSDGIDYKRANAINAVLHAKNSNVMISPYEAAVIWQIVAYLESVSG